MRVFGRSIKSTQSKGKGNMRRFAISANVILFSCGANTWSATINVPFDQGTIQAGINAATSGVDEVVVAPGTYNELINFNGKAITLISSDGPGVTTLAGSGAVNQDWIVKCISGEGLSTVLQGFTIASGSSSTNSALPPCGGSGETHYPVYLP